MNSGKMTEFGKHSMYPKTLSAECLVHVGNN